jgi:F-type H+-transporting ATPase subunit b
MPSKTKSVLFALLLVVLLAGGAVASADAHHADSGVLLKDFLYRLLNFAFVVALLVYFLAKPLKKGLSGRREDIEKALAAAKKAKEEAEAKFAEYDRKLAQATEEIAEISAAIRREGELEKLKIIENAKQMALKIEQDAEKTAALEVAKARVALQREAVQLAVGVAEELLKKNFTKDDDTRLIDEYLQKVGELH